MLPESSDRAAAGRQAQLRDGHAGVSAHVRAVPHRATTGCRRSCAGFRLGIPPIDVEVAVQHTDDPVDALLNGALDIALVTDRDRRQAAASSPPADG